MIFKKGIIQVLDSEAMRQIQCNNIFKVLNDHTCPSGILHPAKISFKNENKGWPANGILKEHFQTKENKTKYELRSTEEITPKMFF